MSDMAVGSIVEFMYGSSTTIGIIGNSPSKNDKRKYIYYSLDEFNNPQPGTKRFPIDLVHSIKILGHLRPELMKIN